MTHDRCEPESSMLVEASNLDRLLESFLREDVGSGDVTTCATVPADRIAEATLVAKEGGVLAGLQAAERVFGLVDDMLSVGWSYTDGDVAQPNTTIGMVRGRAHSILKAERVALNILQRMSGIATATRKMVEKTEPYKAHIRDTRKTAPGLRALDKWAVRLGGGENHRFGLYDMMLIKDNHVAAAGGMCAAIEAACSLRRTLARHIRIEVEVRTLDELQEALATGGFDEVLLDNMVDVDAAGVVNTTRLNDALALIDGRYPAEASGNVTLATVAAIAATGVDYISSGVLTHSARALDISLQIRTT